MDISKGIEIAKNGSALISWLREKGLFPEPVHEEQIAQKQLIERIIEAHFSPFVEAALISNSQRILREKCNQDAIIEIALKELDEAQLPQDGKRPSDDWMSRLLDEAKHVSDEDLRFTWAKLLAGEIECPGSVPIRALHIMSEMTKEYAKAFQEICNCLVWFFYQKEEGKIDSDFVGLAVYSSDYVLEEQGVDLGTVNELEMMGLITPYDIRGKKLDWKHVKNSRIHMYCSGESATIKKWDEEQLKIPSTQLTSVGLSIAKLLLPVKNRNYFDASVAALKKNGLVFAEAPEVSISITQPGAYQLSKIFFHD